MERTCLSSPLFGSQKVRVFIRTEVRSIVLGGRTSRVYAGAPPSREMLRESASEIFVRSSGAGFLWCLSPFLLSFHLRLFLLHSPHCTARRKRLCSSGSLDADKGLCGRTWASNLPLYTVRVLQLAPPHFPQPCSSAPTHSFFF